MFSWMTRRYTLLPSLTFSFWLLKRLDNDPLRLLINVSQGNVPYLDAQDKNSSFHDNKKNTFQRDVPVTWKCYPTSINFFPFFSSTCLVYHCVTRERSLSIWLLCFPLVVLRRLYWSFGSDKWRVSQGGVTVDDISDYHPLFLKLSSKLKHTLRYFRSNEIFEVFLVFVNRTRKFRLPGGYRFIFHGCATYGHIWITHCTRRQSTKSCAPAKRTGCQVNRATIMAE